MMPSMMSGACTPAKAKARLIEARVVAAAGAVQVQAWSRPTTRSRAPGSRAGRGSGRRGCCRRRRSCPARAVVPVPTLPLWQAWQVTVISPLQLPSAFRICVNISGSRPVPPLVRFGSSPGFGYGFGVGGEARAVAFGDELVEVVGTLQEAAPDQPDGVELVGGEGRGMRLGGGIGGGEEPAGAACRRCRGSRRRRGSARAARRRSRRRRARRPPRDRRGSSSSRR